MPGSTSKPDASSASVEPAKELAQLSMSPGSALCRVATFASSNRPSITSLVAGKFDLRTTKFPIGDGEKGRIPTGGNAVMTFTQDPVKFAAVWTFIKYVTGPGRRRWSSR